MNRLLAVLLLAAGTLVADPITLTFAGTATGTLASTAFSNAAFTLTSLADTSDVTVSGSVYEVTAISSEISIDGLPVADFTDVMYWRDPQGAGDMFFSAAGDTGFPPAATLLLINLFVGLETYQFQTAIGPVPGTMVVPHLFGAFNAVPTDRGQLTITSVTGATFSASVPEPDSLWCTLGGLMGLALTIRSTVPEAPRRSRR